MYCSFLGSRRVLSKFMSANKHSAILYFIYCLKYKRAKNLLESFFSFGIQFLDETLSYDINIIMFYVQFERSAKRVAKTVFLQCELRCFFPKIRCEKIILVKSYNCIWCSRCFNHFLVNFICPCLQSSLIFSYKMYVTAKGHISCLVQSL